MPEKGMAAGGAPGPAYYDGVYARPSSYTGPYAKSPLLPIWEWILAYLGKLKAPRILDIGCGTGQFAHYLRDRGYRTYQGVDFSPVAITCARKCVPADFALGDIRETKHYAGTYDVAVALEVLEHLDDDLAIFRKVRPGTRFFYSVPPYDGLGHVRFFATPGEVAARYRPFLAAFEEARVSRWFAGTGFIRERENKEG